MGARYKVWAVALAASMLLVVLTRWSAWSVVLWLLVIVAGIAMFLLGGLQEEGRGGRGGDGSGS